MKALSEVERNSEQQFFDIWCEARLPNGETIRCWPQYRGSQGCKYDWALVKFEVDEEGEDVVLYLAKVLVLYEDIARWELPGPGLFSCIQDDEKCRGPI